MPQPTAHQLLELRATVGILGETLNWWPSQFGSSTARLSLQRLFPHTANRAAIESMSRAAQIRHDAALTGNVYHLFRLPEALEVELADALAARVSVEPFDDDPAAPALAALERLAGRQTTDIGTGPVCLGTPKRLASAAGVRELAAAYLGAFRSQQPVFPYFDAEDAG